MRHVDDGAIHAWLDGQVSDATEAAWIERHCESCPACATRLADERATLAQAEALLSSVAPSTGASRPAFDTLVARAERHSGGSGPAAPSAVAARFRTWPLAAGWAASVALAAALGWIARDDWRSDDQVPQLASHESSERAGAAVAPAGDLTVAAPTLDPAVPARGEPSTPRADQSDQARMASAPTSVAVDRTTIGQAQRRLAETASGTAAELPMPTAPPAAEPFAATAQSAVREALPPAPPAQRPPQSDDTIQYRALPPVLQSSPEPAGIAPAAVAAPPPPAAFPPVTAPAAGGGRGGRGGGRAGGGSSAGTFAGTPAVSDATSARTFVAEPSASPASPFAAAEFPTGGRVMVDGMPVNALTGPTAAQSSAWRQMPRTEAAARTGMALYGITGLMPSMTMLSADGSVVRTIYVTEPGEAVELWQQRAPAPQASGRGSVGAPVLTRPADTFTGSWTATYGDVQVTLRGGANVSAWGERLQVE